jgi:hypothetical protein
LIVVQSPGEEVVTYVNSLYWVWHDEPGCKDLSFRVGDVIKTSIFATPRVVYCSCYQCRSRCYNDKHSHPAQYSPLETSQKKVEPSCTSELS